MTSLVATVFSFQDLELRTQCCSLWSSLSFAKTQDHDEAKQQAGDLGQRCLHEHESCRLPEYPCLSLLQNSLVRVPLGLSVSVLNFLA